MALAAHGGSGADALPFLIATSSAVQSISDELLLVGAVHVPPAVAEELRELALHVAALERVLAEWVAGLVTAAGGAATDPRDALQQHVLALASLPLGRVRQRLPGGGTVALLYHQAAALQAARTELARVTAGAPAARASWLRYLESLLTGAQPPKRGADAAPSLLGRVAALAASRVRWLAAAATCRRGRVHRGAVARLAALNAQLSVLLRLFICTLGMYSPSSGGGAPLGRDRSYALLVSLSGVELDARGALSGDAPQPPQPLRQQLARRLLESASLPAGAAVWSSMPGSLWRLKRGLDVTYAGLEAGHAALALRQLPRPVALALAAPLFAGGLLYYAARPAAAASRAAAVLADSDLTFVSWVWSLPDCPPLLALARHVALPLALYRTGGELALNEELRLGGVRVHAFCRVAVPAVAAVATGGAAEAAATSSSRRAALPLRRSGSDANGGEYGAGALLAVSDHYGGGGSGKGGDEEREGRRRAARAGSVGGGMEGGLRLRRPALMRRPPPPSAAEARAASSPAATPTQSRPAAVAAHTGDPPSTAAGAPTASSPDTRRSSSSEPPRPLHAPALQEQGDSDARNAVAPLPQSPHFAVPRSPGTGIVASASAAAVVNVDDGDDGDDDGESATAWLRPVATSSPRAGSPSTAATMPASAAVAAGTSSTSPLRPPPRDATALPPTLMWIHGGGFVGSSFSSDSVRLGCWAGTAAASTPFLALFPHYTLCPAAAFPVALLELLRVYAWVRERSPRVVIGGDSAGGNLAAALTVLCVAHDGSGDSNAEDEGEGEAVDGADDAWGDADPVHSDGGSAAALGANSRRSPRHAALPPAWATTPLVGLGAQAVPSPPDSLVLVYPALNLNPAPSPSRAIHLADPMVPVGLLRKLAAAYCGDGGGDAAAAASSPLLHPLLAPDACLARFPPTNIIVGGLDPLLDDSIDFNTRLRRLGVRGELLVLRTLPHGWLAFPWVAGVAAAQETVRQWVFAALRVGQR